MNLSPIIIITGPTASGKTSFAEQLAASCEGSIINADAVQMYTPLSIGTAKPDWRLSPIPQYLFDVVDEPVDTSVVIYRSMVINKVKELASTGKPIILVGGSLFYLTSLFYPPRTIMNNADSRDYVFGTTPWEHLNSIDPKRAQELHPNDLYRINRALSIWKSTGIKPSEQKPIYTPPFKATFVCINPQRTILFERINQRVKIMLEGGWIEEAEHLIGTPWQAFITTKGFIGYPELFAWVAGGKKKEELPLVIATIQQQTRVYAKRQIMFWKRLTNMLSKEPEQSTVMELDNHIYSKSIQHLLK